MYTPVNLKVAFKGVKIIWACFRDVMAGLFAKILANYYRTLNSSASVAQLDAPSDWRPGGRGFNPRRGRQHSFVEIDHEILSTVILSLPLIQEGQFLAKECAQYWLTA